MGMCYLGDILKSKIDELLDEIEGVKTYIEDILALSKESFSKKI